MFSSSIVVLVTLSRKYLSWLITINALLQFLRKSLETYEFRLKAVSPAQQLLEKRTLAAELQSKLDLCMKNNLREKRFLLQMYIEKLDGLSPLKKLNQGFSFVADEEGKAVTSLEGIQQGDCLTIHVTDGEIRAKVENRKGIVRV